MTKDLTSCTQPRDVTYLSAVVQLLIPYSPCVTQSDYKSSKTSIGITWTCASLFSCLCSVCSHWHLLSSSIQPATVSDSEPVIHCWAALQAPASFTHFAYTVQLAKWSRMVESNTSVWQDVLLLRLSYTQSHYALKRTEQQANFHHFSSLCSCQLLLISRLLETSLIQPATEPLSRAGPSLQLLNRVPLQALGSFTDWFDIRTNSAWLR